MTVAELDDWTRKRLHGYKLQAIRDDGAKAVAQVSVDAAADRRKSEAATQRLQDLEWKARRGPVTVASARDRHRVVTARNAVVTGRASEFRMHVERIVRSLNATIRYAALPGVNAYAWARMREIETEPIIDDATYAAALHECGHVAHPCPGAPTHRRVKRDDGKGSRCCRCEINAWLWAVRAAREWTRAMQHELAVSLRSYRSFGTPAEQAEIDATTGPMGWHRSLASRWDAGRRTT